MISDNLVLVRFVNFIEHYFVVFIVEFLCWFWEKESVPHLNVQEQELLHLL